MTVEHTDADAGTPASPPTPAVGAVAVGVRTRLAAWSRSRPGHITVLAAVVAVWAAAYWVNDGSGTPCCTTWLGMDPMPG